MLEAVHLAAVGRSFRTRDTGQVQRRGASGLSVGAWFEQRDGLALHVRLERDGDGMRLQRNGQPVRSAAELARRLPVLALSQDGVRRFRTERAERRGLIDWGLFHVKHEFHALWSRYHVALAQRNAALRSTQPLEPWLQPLCEAGEALSAARVQYVERLQARIAEVEAELGLRMSLDVVLQRGWREGSELRKHWTDSESRDRTLGYTASGPHRANVLVSCEGGLGLEQFSAGQVKIAYLVLRLAQLRDFLEERQDAEPIVFFDDLAAELDGDHLAAMLGGLGRQSLQRFVTSPVLTANLSDYADAVFHVKHGALCAATN